MWHGIHTAAGVACAVVGVMVLGIDPGTTRSGWVLWDGERVSDSGVEDNDGVLRLMQLVPANRLVIERFEARGMPMSEDSIETVIWTGRFQQAWRSPESVRLVKRSAVKLALCGTTRAKDPNVRQAVIDRCGAPGTKAAQGPTYGVTSHAWQALAAAIVGSA